MRTRRSNAPLSLVTGARASDGDLARGLVANQDWAVAETWQRFAPMVLLSAQRALGSRTEAEDIVQEVFCARVPEGEDAPRAGAPAQLRVLVRRPGVQGRAAPAKGARLVSVPDSRIDAGGRLPRVGLRIARSPGEAVRAPGSSELSRSAGLRPAADGIHDGRRDRLVHGHFDLHGEAIDGARFESVVSLGRGRPRAGRSHRGERRGADR